MSVLQESLAHTKPAAKAKRTKAKAAKVRHRKAA